ncbi:MAG: FtsX-like permease family protein [Chloroflexota bacterium]|nr:FtsX-like permease family protein [Chloroflexota bacterium]
MNVQIDLTLRHLSRHWRLNVAVLLCLTLASALLASLSSYTAATAARELNQSLSDARPAERNLLITGNRYTFSEALYESLRERLGEILKDRLVIRHVTLPADRQPSTEGTGQKRTVALLDVYSFNKLPENVRLVEGRLPAQVRLNEARGSWRPPPIEAVIGARAAEQSGYGIGDRLTATKAFHRLDIVGIVEPLDPQGDVWGEDLSGFAILTDTNDLDAGGIALPLIIAPGSMQSHYPEAPIFWHEVSWRITLNHHLISPDRAETLHSDLINFQTQSATVRAKTDTGLIHILAETLARLSRVRMTLSLLTAQTLIFVLYTLTTFTSVVVDRSRVELATLSARGSSAWQITQIFGLENLILVLPAGVLLGPGLALGAMHLWGKVAGEAVPSALPGEAWLLSGVVVGLGWLALVLPVFLAAQRNTLAWQPTYARPPQVPVMQKHYLDLYLLAFGGLLYWQLNQAGSVVMRRLGETQLADPLLLLGPSLLLIAAAMVFLRVLPFLLRLVAWFLRHLRGWALPLNLFRLARDPLRPSRVVLLVSLTAGLVLFTRIFGDSLAYGQESLRDDVLAQGVSTALRLNAVTLVLFSVTTFFLVHFFAAQERGREFSILRAMGLSARQWSTLLVTQGLLVLLPGLLAGTLVGLSLSHIMIPYLAQPLAESFGGVTIEVLVDWPAIARLYLLLIGVYGSALVLLWLVLTHTRARQASGMGDE